MCKRWIYRDYVIKAKLFFKALSRLLQVRFMEYFNDGWLKNCPEETKARGESAEGLCLGENVNMWEVYADAQSLQRTLATL